MSRKRSETWGTHYCFVVHADYIEAPLARRRKAAEIIAGHGGDFSALVAVYSRFAGFYVVCSAGFHFHETENVFIPSDQVDFSAAARRAEISRDHGIAEFAQMK